jgi:hypothetical protein
VLTLELNPCALVEAAAHRRAAREKSRGRRTPLLAAAARPWQPSSFCSTLMSLSLWLDAQRSSQLREEQPPAARVAPSSAESSSARSAATAALRGPVAAAARW